LVEFAIQQTVPDARRQYLVRLFQNAQAMSLLVDRNHYETLSGMARGEEDDNERTTLLSAFYISPPVLQRLAADKQLSAALTFAEQHLSGNDQRNFLQQICQQETTLAAIVEQAQLDRVIGLIKLQGQEYHQAFLMRMVLASPRVVEHYGSAGRLEALFATISEVSINTRHQIWDSLLQRVENVNVILKHDGLGDLLKRIGEEPQAPRRGMLIGRLLAHQPVIEHWIANKGLDSIFELIQAESDAQSRQYVLRTLFGSEPALGALLAAGAFDRLYELAGRERE
jgi:hypothetical protein